MEGFVFETDYSKRLVFDCHLALLLFYSSSVCSAYHSFLLPCVSLHLTTQYVDISPGVSYSFYPLPVSVPSLYYTFLLDSTCILSLKERDDSLIFQEATKDALSELFDEYFGSHGRAKFQNMTLHLQRWDMSLPSSTETTASNNSRSSRSTQRTRKYTLPQNKLQLGFNGDALFQYSPAPNEQLLNAVNEHLLSSPQLLSQMGQTIL